MLVRRALTAFAACFVLLLMPYEALVRAAERRYGVRPAEIAPMSTIDIFLEELRSGTRFRILMVGTSRAEAGLRPDVFRPLFGSAFNLGIAGSSSIPPLEFIDRLGLHPDRIIVGISPQDLSPRYVQRGEATIAEHDHRADTGLSEAAVRRLTYTLVHAATPERRRNAGQWLKLRADHGSALGFLNNGAATGPVVETHNHGYRPSSEVADPERFDLIDWHVNPRDYLAHHAETVPHFVAAVRLFTGRGTKVTFVRLPASLTIRRYEETGTAFSEEAPLLARLCGVDYIDGAELMGKAFVLDRRNFSDTEHLNDHGALLFSQALAAKLLSLPPGKPR
jgi:hypothetical protein